jgi:hypothetical protein
MAFKGKGGIFLTVAALIWCGHIFYGGVWCKIKSLEKAKIKRGLIDFLVARTQAIQLPSVALALTMDKRRGCVWILSINSTRTHI